MQWAEAFVSLLTAGQVFHHTCERLIPGRMTCHATATHRFRRTSCLQRRGHPSLAQGQGHRRLHTVMSTSLESSPVEVFRIRGRDIYVKRDDKLDLGGLGIYGNKARKLYQLYGSPPDPLPSVCVSYGGPQSNAMVAIAGLVRRRWKRRMVYITKELPSWLRDNPSGSYLKALQLGVEFRELTPSEYAECFQSSGADGADMEDLSVVDVQHLPNPLPVDTLVIPQGAAMPGAEVGVNMLADEIAQYHRDSSSRAGRRLSLVLPSGTGTTALFLTRRLASVEGIGVCAVPCVGDGAYLRRQLELLDGRTGNVGRLPRILEGSPKHRFGTPSKPLADVWNELRRVGLVTDLLYAPYAWKVLFEHWHEWEDQGTSIMYVHTGGLEGLESQLARYRRKGWLLET